MTMHLRIALAALVLLAACATKPPSGRVEDVTTARATVTAIDLPSRQVTLKGPDGQETVVVVGDAVKNLGQVKVGDEVLVSYTEAVAWQVKPAGQGTPGVSTQDNITTAQPGARPGGTATSSVSMTATITDIDLAKGTVTLTGPGGKAHTFKARNPDNLRRVKVGDLVDITYSEALAISVQPVDKK